VPVAVEETLRLNGPVQIMFRVPKVDVEIRVARFRPVRRSGSATHRRTATKRCSKDPDAFSLERSDLKAKPISGSGTAFTSAWVQGLHAWKLHAP